MYSKILMLFECALGNAHSAYSLFCKESGHESSGHALVRVNQALTLVRGFNALALTRCTFGLGIPICLNADFAPACRILATASLGQEDANLHEHCKPRIVFLKAGMTYNNNVLRQRQSLQQTRKSSATKAFSAATLFSGQPKCCNLHGGIA